MLPKCHVISCDYSDVVYNIHIYIIYTHTYIHAYYWYNRTVYWATGYK